MTPQPLKHKQLVDACSSSVAGVVAVVAASTSIKLQVIAVACLEFIEKILISLRRNSLFRFIY